jgi:hypothetical protein
VRLVLLLVSLACCGRIAFESGATAQSDASADASADAAALTCAGTWCDGFDGSALDPAWTIAAIGGTVDTDATHTHHGSRALHVRTDAIATTTVDPHATVVAYQGVAEAAISGAVYTRAWAYFASPHPAPLFDQVINLANDPGVGISMGARDGFVANNDYTASVYAESSTIPLPLDRWTCLQFEMPSGTVGTARVRIDDMDVADVAIPGSSPQPAPTHIYLGLQWVGSVSSQPAVDAWFDDFEISATPTTCN